MFTAILEGFVLVWIVALIVLMFRNYKVAELRGSMLRTMRPLCNADVEAGRAYEWRLDMYDTVTYSKMLFSFWKHLTPEAFYKDTSFLK